MPQDPLKALMLARSIGPMPSNTGRMEEGIRNDPYLKAGNIDSINDFFPVAAITKLSKGQMLNNLLNHIEDLKLTPYQRGIEAIAEKAPHVLGNIGAIRQVPQEALGNRLGIFATLGKNVTDPKALGDVVLRNIPPRDVDPAYVLGHEVGHAAQKAIKGPRMHEQYLANKEAFEEGANKTGRNVVELVWKLYQKSLGK